MLLAKEHAEEELHELRRKFHPHHDYLNLIIPSTWYLIGLFAVEFYFYHAQHLVSSLKRMTEVEPYFSSSSTSLQFFLALSLFIAGFTIIYVIGQLINGFSALVLDRTIVKKLLKYPFTLYEYKLHSALSDDNANLLRRAMMQASYTVFCLNLIPVVFLELVAFMFATRVITFETWVSAHYNVTALLLALLVWAHFGRPSRSKAARYTLKASRGDIMTYNILFKVHMLGLATVYLSLYLSLVYRGQVGALLVLPAINAAIVLSERYLVTESRKALRRRTRLLTYAKACFTNPIYFAAKLTGYGDMPSTALIRAVRSGIGSDSDSKDFFWMTYLTIQNRGLGSSQTVYHFLAMYGMVRNICNATAFVLMSSVAVFWVEWPLNHGQGVVVWSVGLCVLMYALFARYLYVYGAYFSKYVLRSGAFILRASSPLVTL